MGISMEKVVCIADRDQGDIQALANSIEQVGLLQPIVLRKTDADTYEVIDGRRRFAALQSLGLEELPEWCYTFPNGHYDPAILAHVANTERKDLTPAEEVKHLAELAKNNTMEHLCSTFGRTPGWVKRRLQIASLIPEWLKVLDDPELSACWSLDKLALIARQPKRIQKHLRYMVSQSVTPKNYSMADIETAISRLNRDLSAVIFDVTECAKCPENTVTQELLFDDVTGGGVCMNEHCWMRKTIAACREILKKEKLIPIRGSGTHYSEQDCEFADKLKAKYGHEYAEYRDPEDGETANALIVSGSDIGKRMIVTARAKQTTGTVTAADEVRAEAEKQPPTIEEMEAILKRKRNKKALQLLLDYLENVDDPEDWILRIPDGVALSDLLLVVKLYGFHGRYMNDYTCRLTPEDSKEPAEIDDIRSDVYAQAFEQIQRHLQLKTKETLSQMNEQTLYGIARLLRIEHRVKKMIEQAETEVPEPKALTEAKAKQAGKTKGGN